MAKMTWAGTIALVSQAASVSRWRLPRGPAGVIPKAKSAASAVGSLHKMLFDPLRRVIERLSHGAV